MCGRFAQERSTSELAEIFGAEDRVDLPGGRFNVAPTDDAAVVVQRDEHRAVTAFRWGLIPHWSESKDTGNRMFNARSETIDRNPAFRYAFGKRRCLVPVDAFYEWQRDGKVKTPFAVVKPDGRPLALAGLWAGWKDPETDAVTRSFTILTTGPNEMMKPVHNRMPVLIPESAWDQWLDPTLTKPSDLRELRGLLEPAGDDELRMYRVSRLVNDVRNDGPDLVAPVGSDPAAGSADTAVEPQLFPEAALRTRKG
ncbi:MAG TPA: SOS response-associated peptidase [Candidatus Limnocylindrales bacterium]|nr:SOS response-associated peptidase [Candidatus Limnocylindrales bacterium]